MEQQKIENEMITLFRKLVKVDFSSYIENLSREEFFMLGVIDDYSRENLGREGIRVSEIAETLDVSSPAVSRMLRGLERKKYICRKTSSISRRNTIVKLTPDGVSVYQNSKRNINDLLQRVMKIMGKDEMKELIRLWERLTQIFVEETGKDMKQYEGDDSK